MTRFDSEPMFVCRNLNDILRTPAIKVKPFVYKDLAMSLQTIPAPRFVRRTSLAPGEYRKNFRQIDREVIDAVTSPEADRVTPLMGKIYLRLSNAPDRFWEREGVLRFEAEQREGREVRAWKLLCETLGVASATANKALRWMHEQGIVGYFAGKNGVGIRVFLNRATSSIGGRAGKKILEFPPASSRERHASRDEAAFSDSYAVSENLEIDNNSRAPKDGADRSLFDKTSPAHPPRVGNPHPPDPSTVTTSATPSGFSQTAPLEEIVLRLKAELEPAMREAARQVAAREHERTREWLESRGLPKAARVAQHEAYNVLRKYGVVGDPGHRAGLKSQAGRGEYTPPAPNPLSGTEVEDLAQACVALLEAQGQSIDRTLSEMSIEGGGFLLPADAAKVRARAEVFLRAERGE